MSTLLAVLEWRPPPHLFVSIAFMIPPRSLLGMRTNMPCSLEFPVSFFFGAPPVPAMTGYRPRAETLANRRIGSLQSQGDQWEFLTEKRRVIASRPSHIMSLQPHELNRSAEAERCNEY